MTRHRLTEREWTKNGRKATFRNSNSPDAKPYGFLESKVRANKNTPASRCWRKPLSVSGPWDFFYSLMVLVKAKDHIDTKWIDYDFFLIIILTHSVLWYKKKWQTLYTVCTFTYVLHMFTCPAWVTLCTRMSVKNCRVTRTRPRHAFVLFAFDHIVFVRIRAHFGAEEVSTPSGGHAR